MALTGAERCCIGSPVSVNMSMEEIDELLNNPGCPEVEGSVPALPQTWANSQWAEVFSKHKNEGEVREEQLIQMLSDVGHVLPDEKAAKSIAHQITKFGVLCAEEVFEFFLRYETKMRKRLIHPFVAYERLHGKVTTEAIEAMIVNAGYTPIPQSIDEALEEAARDVGADTQGGDDVPLAVFERLMYLLELREGFSKSELNAIEHVFNRFDKDNCGSIDSQDLKSLLDWMQFVADDSIAQHVMARHSKSAKVTITFNDFVILMRMRLGLEYSLTQELFQSIDMDEDGFLQPGEVMRLFQRLGISLSPETMLELSEEFHEDVDISDLRSVWRSVQVLRVREGFNRAEREDIQEAFCRFALGGRGQLLAKRLPDAMVWLGHYVSAAALSAKKAVIGIATKHYITEEEFVKLLRHICAAERRSMRRAFIKYADDSGAGPLHATDLQSAVKCLNRVYVNDASEWLNLHRPCARLKKKRAHIDMEDFRLAIQHCRSKERDKIREHCGFTEVECTRLRIEFVKHATKGKNGDRIAVFSPGLVRLFSALFPLSRTSTEVRDRLKQCLENNQVKNNGVEWDAFLRVMRTYEDLVEEDRERNLVAAMEELRLPMSELERHQEVFQSLDEHGPSVISVHDLQSLVRNIAAISEAQAMGVHDELCDVHNETKADGELRMLQQVRQLRNMVELAYEPDGRPRRSVEHKRKSVEG